MPYNLFRKQKINFVALSNEKRSRFSRLIPLRVNHLILLLNLALVHCTATNFSLCPSSLIIRIFSHTRAVRRRASPIVTLFPRRRCKQRESFSSTSTSQRKRFVSQSASKGNFDELRSRSEAKVFDLSASRGTSAAVGRGCGARNIFSK